MDLFLPQQKNQGGEGEGEVSFFLRICRDSRENPLIYPLSVNYRLPDGLGRTHGLVLTRGRAIWCRIACSLGHFRPSRKQTVPLNREITRSTPILRVFSPPPKKKKKKTKPGSLPLPLFSTGSVS